MTPLPFDWPYALVFWPVLFWAFLPEARIVNRGRRQQGAADGRSLQVVVYGQFLAQVVAYWLAFRPWLQVPGPLRAGVFFAGVGVMIAGSRLRRHCFRSLGASFTGDVRVRSGQEVVTAGAYRFVRHPSYTAGIIMNTGIGLALDNWASALVMLAVTFAAYVVRMNVEERALLQSLGEPYRQFMRTRKRLIPYVY